MPGVKCYKPMTRKLKMEKVRSIIRELKLNRSSKGKQDSYGDERITRRQVDTIM